MVRLTLIVVSILASPASGQQIVAERTIQARSIIQASDILVSEDASSDPAVAPVSVIGKEARVTIFAGQTILPAALSEPAVISRNEIVILDYSVGRLVIRTEGRSLGRGAVGDAIRVMNLGSRATVTGIVTAPGQISVH